MEDNHSTKDFEKNDINELNAEGNENNLNTQTTPQKKLVKHSNNLNHLSPDISPRAVHIENYQDSKNARNTFVQTSTLKNLESGNTKSSFTHKLSSPQQTKSSKIKVNLNRPGFKEGSKSRLGKNDDHDLVRASSAGKEISERVAQRLEEHKMAVEMNKNNGKEALVANLHKKELENHLRILENRIMKLELEDKNLQKKIVQTSHKTEKTLESKLRHQDDLMTKQERKNQEQQKLEQRKGEINNQRDVFKVNLKEKSDQAFKKRLDTATNVKDIKKETQNKRKENSNQFQEKSSNLIQKIRDDDKNAKTQRFDKENQKKQQKNDEYKNRTNNNKEETDRLENKLRELEEQEQMLVDKIKQTYTLHKTKYDEFQKVFKTKVDPNTPIDVNVLKSNDHVLDDEKVDNGQEDEEVHINE